MPIYKNPENNDTRVAEESPNGWVEISQDELHSILDSRRIDADPQVAIKAMLAPVKLLREAAINRINGIADREQRAGNTTIRAIGDATVLALLAMTKNLPADHSLVEVTVAQRYAGIVDPLQQSAPELLSAFADMDQ